MIELRTGLPGNGKTLSIVQELAAMQAKWDKGGEEARPVFVHNIRDLALPHAPLPLDTVTHRGGIEQKIPDWSQVPDGSLVIIDEGQDLFPPRSSQSMAPPHVAWLNTHRHRGVDILISTQHPKLVDASLRALVGKHKHYRRVFGMQRSIVYEWDACSDSLAGMKDATKSFFNFPRDAFKWYKSAEVHTRQKFKLPLWLGIPVLGVLLGAFFVPRAYSVLANGAQGKGIQAAKQAEPAKRSGSPAAAPGQLQPGQPAQAPAPAVQVVSLPAKRYVGCISSATKCQCLSDGGEIVEEPEMCRESSERVGLLVAMHVGATPAGIVTRQQTATETTQEPSSPPARAEGPAPASSAPGERLRQPDGLRQPEGIRPPDGIRKPDGIRQAAY